MGAQSRHLGVSALSSFVLLRAPSSAASAVSRPGAGATLDLRVMLQFINAKPHGHSHPALCGSRDWRLIELNRFAHHRFIGVRTLEHSD